MKKIIIDRSKWRTGNIGAHKTCSGETQLLNENGSMCCLGFLSNQLGVPKEDLLNIPAPYGINKKWSDIINVLLIGAKPGRNHNIFTTNAIKINDDYLTTPQEKEIQITNLFKDHGFEVEFTGEFTIINNEI